MLRHAGRSEAVTQHQVLRLAVLAVLLAGLAMQVIGHAQAVKPPAQPRLAPTC
jgi:hypothetical protein